ncbi:DUF1186 domain-containing protein [Paraburkholderia sp. CNPSo 3274]|uniref:DUF1186 domain-containing protein n=1 Tax=Paraburkholderia sp. CNPSo 3274 TaxID=2940932 RepID=UPI0020B84AB0|nr:DUF1186 domain-containing protein [Paraburkholderia sp. CNPSo 3274]MCP3713363.1 DUF1186 domain-containing protein [Paraburkholderia sp. CNPSo 3274]
MNHGYPPPVSQLLTLGETFPQANERDLPWASPYGDLGITREHVSLLVTILRDQQFYTDTDTDTDTDTAPEMYAPIHAWRMLAHLKATEAVPALLALLARIDDEDDDWVSEELPKVFSAIGPDTLAPLERYLADRNNGIYARSCACRSIGTIAEQHPTYRTRCVDLLTKQLGNFRSDNPFVNASLVYNLVDLRAVESIDTIRAAFADNCVELSIQGDIEDVEIGLGLRTQRATPRKLDPSFERMQRALFGAIHRAKLPMQARPKIGRNDPCPCGSGKKYKKCCMVAES